MRPCVALIHFASSLFCGGKVLHRGRGSELGAFRSRSSIITRGFDGGIISGGTAEPGNWDFQPHRTTRSCLLAVGEEIVPYLNRRRIYHVIGREILGSSQIPWSEDRPDRGHRDRCRIGDYL